MADALTKKDIRELKDTARDFEYFRVMPDIEEKLDAVKTRGEANRLMRKCRKLRFEIADRYYDLVDRINRKSA